MRDLSALLSQHVVLPLNELGVPIGLRGVQAVLVLLPVAVVVAAFVRAWWKKQQQLRDAGM
jgi:hypothetical protein